MVVAVVSSSGTHSSRVNQFHNIYLGMEATIPKTGQEVEGTASKRGTAYQASTRERVVQ